MQTDSKRVQYESDINAIRVIVVFACTFMWMNPEMNGVVHPLLMLGIFIILDTISDILKEPVINLPKRHIPSSKLKSINFKEGTVGILQDDGIIRKVRFNDIHLLEGCLPQVVYQYLEKDTSIFKRGYYNVILYLDPQEYLHMRKLNEVFINNN